MVTPVRVLYDNAADRGSVSVSGVTVMPIGNLRTNNKNEVWRSSAGTTGVTFTTTFASPETISAISMPYTNFSSSATMRVRLYSDMACTNLLTDTGTVLCSQGGGARVQGLSAQQSASAYSYCGGVAATVWALRTPNTQGIKIDITDTSNLQGYLEAARLVIGDYWQCDYSPEYGASLSFEDTTSNFRTDAGNLLSDVGTRHKLLSMTLSFMSPQDRANLCKLVKYVGMSFPVLISLYPENSDKGLEQAHTVYGKFTKMSTIAASSYMVYSAPIEIEGI